MRKQLTKYERADKEITIIMRRIRNIDFVTGQNDLEKKVH